MASKPGRKLIDWLTDPDLNITKMLCGVIKLHEAVNEESFPPRLRALIPPVIERVTGKSGVTLQIIKDHVKATQGPDREITNNKLWQRADKVLRYSEFTDYWEPTLEAYREIVNKGIKPAPATDPGKFTDAQLKARLVLQEHRCAYCRAPLDEHNPPVADHFYPLALGGRSIDENCRAACCRCNSEKGDMDPFEYGRKVGLRSNGRKNIMKKAG